MNALGTGVDESNETGPLQISYAGRTKHGYLAISCLRDFPISIEEGAEALSSVASRPELFQAMNRAYFTPECDNGDRGSTRGMADTGIANRLLRQRRPMESALGRWLEGNALGKAPSSSCSSFDLVNLENKFMLDIFCRHKLETEIDGMGQSKSFQCLRITLQVHNMALN